MTSPVSGSGNETPAAMAARMIEERIEHWRFKADEQPDNYERSMAAARRAGLMEAQRIVREVFGE